MASKRKSTVPCMIPPKIIHMAEEQEGGLPDHLPPPAKETFIRKEEEEEEDQVVRAQSSKDASQSSWPEGGDAQQTGDSYSCRPCHFESQDLNLFLDHVYSCHPDFRADPSFYCVDCGVSMEKFEGLALHNARAHPSVGLADSATHTALQVRKRDRRTTVEQNLVGGEGSKESEISITKTPIMKMLKGKSEHKRIVVSHSAGEELNLDSFTHKEAEKKDPPATMPAPAAVHNGSTAKVPLPSAIQIVNGSGTLPVLKTAISQVVTVVQNRTPHQQSAPITVSSSSSAASTTSSRNLPKVMIPLSSIPTYNAAMDSSSFLKNSFSKFPYPTKAELCYLTVVTKYPEEQIKIWFTAQRLKQGISWSPEEIEDSRRKMFNTIIQAPSSAPQQQNQHQQSRHAHHNPAQHTITVLPTPLGSNGIPHILQGSLMGQGGVIVTQPVIANGIQVGSTPVTLAVTPKPQARPQMQAKPAAALIADKGVSMVVGAVGSSSRVTSSSSSSSSSSNSSTSSLTSIRSNGANNGNGSTSSTSKTNGDNGGKVAEIVAPPAPKVAVHSSRTLPSSFLDPSFYKSKKSQEQLGALKQSFVRCEFPGQEEVERLTKITGLTVREVRKWFSDRRYHNRNLKGSRPGAGVLFSGSSLLDLTDSPSPTGSPKPQQSSRSPPATSRRAPQSQAPDFTAIRYKERDPQQVRALEASFALDPLPSTEEVDRLRTETKMTRREIDGWFADRRKRMVPKKKGEEDEQEDEEEVEDEETADSKDTSLASEERKLDVEDPLQGTSTQQHVKEEKSKDDALGGSAPKVNPIKINLKMLKVTKTDGKPEAEGSQPERETDSPKSPPPFTSGRGKKTAEQLHLLRQVFARTHWPSSLQYDELISKTGLPRPEVVRWFGDSRYVYKNGQLKWLESYQRAAAEEEEKEKADTTVLKDHPTSQTKVEGPHSEGTGESARPNEEHAHRGYGTQASQPPEGDVEPAPVRQDQGSTKEKQPRQSDSGLGSQEEADQVTNPQPVKASPGGD